MGSSGKGFTHIRKGSGGSGAHQVERQGGRGWESMYRGRWAYDKVVRSTHGVNCTGSCSWNIYVKNGVVAWENQAHDYPQTPDDMPDHEPRGCQRGASFSWYLYSPLRIKHPYLRAELAELWREACATHATAYEAWASIASDPEKMRRYKSARGMGGMVRATWDEVTELVASSLLYTAYTYGPDRNFGFSVIPAMSMLSYAAGARFNNLMGGAQLSFYDWYADLPPASPQMWGDQTDVPESSDWYNAGYLMMWGSNVPQTRTPDAHFMTEVRYKGTKVVAVSPDYAEFCEFADTWIAPNVGTDSALAMAMGHVILTEYYWKKPEPFFIDYAKRYTDMPFVVFLDRCGETYETGRFVNASDLGIDLPNPEFEFAVFDAQAQRFSVPNGCMGERWGDASSWNLNLQDALTGEQIDPQLTFVGEKTEAVPCAFPYFGEGAGSFVRNVPVRRITCADGTERLVATVHDILLSQYGVDRGLGGECAASYDDASVAFTPAWQEAITGVDPQLAIETAREFADNSVRTHGRSMIIMGAGINHWYHADDIYRTVLNLVVFCATEGRNGGGWAHYVGQEKLRPAEGWASLMTATDWQKPPRLMNATSFFYFATDQWRSDEIDTRELASTLHEPRYRHSGDYNVLAARLGWLPSYPTFNASGASIVEAARKAGATDDAGIVAHTVDALKKGDLDFACADPDAPENFPRNLIVWRANLLGSSAKGNEYFFRHLLGAKDGILEEERMAARPTEINVRDQAATGKLDLLVSLDFRMTTTPLYSDVVLPTATWYEKADLSSTDMHPFIHPFSEAVKPGWESKSDWDIFRLLAQAVSKVATEAQLPPLEDIVAVPLGHDSKDELAQPCGAIHDWKRGEAEAIPGKTMPRLVHVTRDYTKTFDKWIALGPNAKQGMGAVGLTWDSSAEYESVGTRNGRIEDERLISYGMPSIETAVQACDTVLALSSASNGGLAVKAFDALEKRTGLTGLAEQAQGSADVRMTYADTQVQPREVVTTPVFTGSNTGRRYTPFTLNIENRVPFRTITGRQSFYLDHELMREWGEQLATYKPILDYQPLKLAHDAHGQREIVLKFMTPHNKWSTHSMYFDNEQMLTLFRGGQSVWMNEDDAAAIGVIDNDWIEVFNRNGVVTARVVTTARIPRGSVFMYHAQDRHINVPGTKLTGTRGSSHNGPTHIHVKPTHMIGGYGQLSYGFNYYGTTGNQRDILVVVRKMEEVDWLEG